MLKVFVTDIYYFFLITDEHLYEEQVNAIENKVMRGGICFMG